MANCVEIRLGNSTLQASSDAPVTVICEPNKCTVVLGCAMLPIQAFGMGNVESGPVLDASGVPTLREWPL